MQSYVDGSEDKESANTSVLSLMKMVGLGPSNQASLKKFANMLKDFSSVAEVRGWQRDG